MLNRDPEVSRLQRRVPFITGYCLLIAALVVGSAIAQQGPEIDLQKDGVLDLGGNGVADPGDLINYTFRVENPEEFEYFDVSVSDPDVPAITCPSGNPIPVLLGGNVETCTGSYAITQNDIDAGFKFNMAMVEAQVPQEGGPPTVTDTDTHTEPIPQAPAMTLDKDGALDLGGNGVADPGDLIEYTFEVANVGGAPPPTENVTLFNISVTDPAVPSISCPSGNPIPSLAPGATETCTGSYPITQVDIDAGFKFNSATASGQDPLGGPVSDSDNYTEPIPQAPELALVKDGALDLGSNGSSDPGDIINYTFDVSNPGNTTLINIEVTDTVVGTVACPSGNPIPTLAPGAAETCTGTYAITQDDIDAGSKSNTATAEDEEPMEVTATSTFVIDIPAPIPTLGLVGLLLLAVLLAATMTAAHRRL